MQYRVLGSLEATTDLGEPRPVIGTMQRRVLVALLLDAGAVVPATHLRERVGATEGALRSAIARLRDALGKDAIETVAPGYRLGPCEIDANRFEASCRAARDGAPSEAATMLTEALALWRGSAYADLADLDWVRPDAVRLDELRAGATEDLAEAMLALGRFADATAELERHRAEQPFRDRPCGLLMRALAAQGRLTEALRTYQEHRRWLADEAGIEPSAELRDLEQQLAAGTHCELRRYFEPDPAPHRALPVVATTLVGRAEMVNELVGALRGHRLLTLLGPGGIGKSRLAIEVAGHLAALHPDGCWFVELAPVSDPSDVDQAVASQLSVPETGQRSRRDDVVAYLRRQDVLVVLDNCEHVLRSVTGLVAAILRDCPRVVVLATSRRPLAVESEQLWPVPPLDPAGDGSQLFVDRAREVLPSFAAEHQREAVAAICHRLDGVPLAIELAAARVRALAPQELLQLLDDRFRLLDERRAADWGAHRSLRATVEWSFGLLDIPDRLRFARLAVFMGWFDLDGALAVTGGEDPDRLAAVEGIERLVDHSMVVVEDRPAGRRYRLLDTLRQFGREHLDDGEWASTRRRHAAHQRDRVERLRDELRGPDEQRAIADLDDQWDDLRAAQSWAIEHGDADVALRIAAALVWEAWWRHRFEASEWAARAVDLDGAAAHPALAEALVTMARAHMIRDAHEAYAECLERAEAAVRLRGGRPPVALLFAQATLVWWAEDLIGLLRAETAAGERAAELGDVVSVAHALADQADITGWLRDGPAARRLAADALATAQLTGNPTIVLWAEVRVLLCSALPWPDMTEPGRALVGRAEELRNQIVLSTLPGITATFEAEAGYLGEAADRLRRQVLRLVAGEAWWSWIFVGSSAMSVLAFHGRYPAAAKLLGQVRLAGASFPEKNFREEIRLVTAGLAPAELAALLDQGKQLTAQEGAELALNELEAIIEARPTTV